MKRGSRSFVIAEKRSKRRVLTVLARSRDGVELSEVRSELATFAGRIETDQKAESPEYAGWRLAATPFVDVWAGFVGPAGPILLGAVGFVLSIACANIAGFWRAPRRAAKKWRCGSPSVPGADAYFNSSSRSRAFFRSAAGSSALG